MSEDHAFPCYGAVPFRALRDKRLFGVPIVLLGIIAAHDRFGRNGQGCTASQGRLAELVGCRREAINAAVGLLDELGYITCGLDEKTGRRRSYSVRYDNAADNAAFRSAQARPKRQRACAPERTSPSPQACAPERTSSPPEPCAAERTSPPSEACAAEHTSPAQALEEERTFSPEACAPERTTSDTEIPSQAAVSTGEFQSVPIKEYIQRSCSEKTTCEAPRLSGEQGAASKPPDLGPEDDPTAIPNRSLQNANERMWRTFGQPKLTATAMFQADRRRG